jgi:endoglucanase
MALAGLAALAGAGQAGQAAQAAQAGHADEAGSAAMALARTMSPGFNLGNTLEAIPDETAWGNPPPNQAFFDAAAAAGFRSVRIPVAWSQYADADNVIRAEWMAHVRQTVDQARRAGLVVLLNVHWDGGWMQPTFARERAVRLKLATFWLQIAEAFKDYDEHLLFAGTNETAVDGVYGPPTEENCKVQNGLLQTFVKAVRSTGGRNAQRVLVVQAYATNIDAAVSCNATLPVDTVPGRLMMEVHYYDPFDFTINGKSQVWQWGSIATDPKATETWADEPWVEKKFGLMQAAFVDKGVPVILGEYAADMKPAYPGMKTYRDYWIRTVTRSAFRHGLVPMYWDVGGLIDRRTGALRDADAVHAIVEAAR